MRKITDLKETRLRTVYNTDEFGNRYRDAEEWIFTRVVKTISPGPRFGQYLIDSLLINILIYFLGYLFDFVTNSSMYLFLYLFNGLWGISIFSLYYFIFETIFQKTPGKFIMRSVVIDEYGNKPDVAIIALRSLIRIIPFEPFSCIGEKFSYGWHDKWSRTWVVTENELRQLKKLQNDASEFSN